MKLALASELKECQNKIELLQKKGQEKHLVIWSALNPELKGWSETALGYLESFKILEKYGDSDAGSPEMFLYSNSLESCTEFTTKYSAEIKKQEFFELISVGLVFFVVLLALNRFFRKKGINYLLGLVSILCLFVIEAQASSEEVLRVYSYDALTGSNSFGEYLSDTFFKKYGKKVRFISFGTAGEALNQIALEGSSSRADMVMGIDEVLFRKHEKKEWFEIIDESVFAILDTKIKKNTPNSFVPFDYGYLAFLYDESRSHFPKNVSLKKIPELLGSKQKVVLQDPRTSSIGLEFLVWTFESLGEEVKSFWLSLTPHILTVSPGWSGAYELFLRKQADLVVSYTTSPAYHHMKEKKFSIRPLIFDEGHFKQVEGMCILKTSRQKEAALKFIKHVLGPDAQRQLPTFQWMYPVRQGTPLPSEFVALPIPKEVELRWERVTSQKDQWVRDWTLMLSQDPK